MLLAFRRLSLGKRTNNINKKKREKKHCNGKALFQFRREMKMKTKPKTATRKQPCPMQCHEF